MDPPYEALIRQMLMIGSYGFSYPEERKSRLRLLQRDMNAIIDISE